ncbi:uncharacterized protein LOC116604027 [Nematostella vectensis]|uniref:uncharacterized protein LOC116604027 n=1 Tax=Nematostella vectensis TaxID=45351 RepID=UPI0020774EBB|nr:uncharacterized protein LOC116604027 [Nematostella vectensis]
MPLKKFDFFFKPDVRLVILQNTVYKIKIVCKNKFESKRLSVLCKNKSPQLEIERIITAVLCTDELEPVYTDLFIISPSAKKWEAADQLQFQSSGKPLEISPYVYVFNIAINQGGKHRKHHLQETVRIAPPASVAVQTSPKRRIRCGDNTVVNRANEKEDQDYPKLNDEESSKKRHLVEEYDPKNRHDVETQYLREQLRYQELARPSRPCEDSVMDTSSSFDKRSRGFFGLLRKWFGEEKDDQD